VIKMIRRMMAPTRDMRRYTAAEFLRTFFMVVLTSGTGERRLAHELIGCPGTRRRDCDEEGIQEGWWRQEVLMPGAPSGSASPAPFSP
jgi:hypothetical protein